jgi:hypothetical protein
MYSSAFSTELLPYPERASAVLRHGAYTAVNGCEAERKYIEQKYRPTTRAAPEGDGYALAPLSHISVHVWRAYASNTPPRSLVLGLEGPSAAPSLLEVALPLLRRAGIHI